MFASLDKMTSFSFIFILYTTIQKNLHFYSTRMHSFDQKWQSYKRFIHKNIKQYKSFQH